MRIANKNFDTENNVYIIGILNVTPDSFSDGGLYNNIDSALKQTEKMIKDGASIIDVGGESTRPNYTKIGINEEIDRVSSYIAAIKKNFDIPVSLDSYKEEVLKANINQIDMINDIWGLKWNPCIADLVASSNLPYVLMHNRAKADYTNFIEDFFSDIKESLAIAKKAGIKKENIIIDGGVGFQKTYEQNLITLNNTKDLKTLGYPIMVAVSNKSVIGLTLNEDVNHRLYGTLATTAHAVMEGASFVRVHDVRANYEIIKMIKSIKAGSKWTQ
ncbi:MAG: dihydropteroate synthase [Spirochaetaceae bacterium]|nr:dihydropteroate synthase [Spirochaetaceae bacterium]